MPKVVQQKAARGCSSWSHVVTNSPLNEDQKWLFTKTQLMHADFAEPLLTASGCEITQAAG